METGDPGSELPETEVIVGAAVLAAWVVLIYAGLTWFWRMRERDLRQAGG